MNPLSPLAWCFHYAVLAALWLEARALVLALSLFKKAVRPSAKAKSWHLETGLSGRREALILRLMNAMPGFCRFKAHRDLKAYLAVEQILARHSDLHFLTGGYSYHLQLSGAQSFGYHKDVDVIVVSPRIGSLISELKAHGWRHEERSHAHCFFKSLIKIDLFHYEWNAERTSVYFVPEPQYVSPAREIEPRLIECFGGTVSVAHPAFIERIFDMIQSPNTKAKAQRVITRYHRGVSDQGRAGAPNRTPALQ